MAETAKSLTEFELLTPSLRQIWMDLPETRFWKRLDIGLQTTITGFCSEDPVFSYQSASSRYDPPRYGRTLPAMGLADAEFAHTNYKVASAVRGAPRSRVQ